MPRGELHQVGELTRHLVLADQLRNSSMESGLPACASFSSWCICCSRSSSCTMRCVGDATGRGWAARDMRLRARCHHGCRRHLGWRYGGGTAAGAGAGA